MAGRRVSAYGPFMRLFERMPWSQRIYGDGWDNGIQDAVWSVEWFLQQHDGPTVPRTEVERLAADLRAELEDA